MADPRQKTWVQWITLNMRNQSSKNAPSSTGSSAYILVNSPWRSRSVHALMYFYVGNLLICSLVSYLLYRRHIAQVHIVNYSITCTYQTIQWAMDQIQWNLAHKNVQAAKTGGPNLAPIKGALCVNGSYVLCLLHKIVIGLKCLGYNLWSQQLLMPSNSILAVHSTHYEPLCHYYTSLL